MKTKSLPGLIIASLAAVLILTSLQKENVSICKNGKALSRIVIPSCPSELENHASVVLQNHLHQITGADFEIVSDDTRARKNDIHIGQVNRTEIAELDLAELDEDGKMIPKKDIQEFLHAFVSMCDLNNVTRIHEWHTPPREYMKLYNGFLTENSD